LEQRTPAELAQLVVGVDISALSSKSVRAALQSKGVRAVSRSKISRIIQYKYAATYGSLEINYSTLRAYFMAVASQHKDFYYHIRSTQTADGDSFTSCFFTLPYARRFTQKCVRYLATDATWARRQGTGNGGGTWVFSVAPIVGLSRPNSRHTQSSSVLIAATFYNGTENNDTWDYHLKHLAAANLFIGDAPVVIAHDDRNGVDELVNKASSKFVNWLDLCHIARNVAGDKTLQICAGWPAILKTLRPIALSKTTAEFDKEMADLVKAPPEGAALDLAQRQKLHGYIIRRFVKRARCWVAFYCSAPTYGLQTTNNVETHNAVMNTIGVRNMPIRAAVATLLAWAAEKFHEIQQLTTPPTDDTLIRWPLREELLPLFGRLGEDFLKTQTALSTVKNSNLSADGLGGQVQMQDLSTFNVTITGTVGRCSCGKPQTLGVPCVHVVRIWTMRARPTGFLGLFIAPGLKQADLKHSVYGQAGACSIDMALLARDKLFKPAAAKTNGEPLAQRKGRQQGEKRKKSIGEHANSSTATAASSSTTTATPAAAASAADAPAKKQVHHCGLCKQAGHNARSCPTKAK
jgi:hypothetical protein